MVKMVFFRGGMMEAAFSLDLLKQWCDGDLTRTCWKDLIATLQIWYSIQPSYSVHYLRTLFHNYTDMNLTWTCSLCTVRIHQHLLEVNGGGNVWRGDLAEAQVRNFTSLFPLCQCKTMNQVPPNPCREEAGVQDSFLTYEVYKDDITMQLVVDACKLLGK